MTRAIVVGHYFLSVLESHEKLTGTVFSYNFSSMFQDEHLHIR